MVEPDLRHRLPLRRLPEPAPSVARADEFPPRGVCHPGRHDQEGPMTEPTDKVHWAEGKLTLSLWFDDDAEQAWELYSSLFTDAELQHVSAPRAERDGPRGPGAHHGLEAQRPRHHGDQRRPDVLVHARGLPRRAVRDPGRDRPPLGRPHRRRRQGGPVRVARGPLRPQLADRAEPGSASGSATPTRRPPSGPPRPCSRCRSSTSPPSRRPSPAPSPSSAAGGC